MRHYLVCYAGTDFVCGFFDSLRVAVGESEFGEYGVHLGGVFACYSKNVEHFAFWIFFVVFPGCYACYGFVAGFASFESVFGYDDVCCEKFRVGNKDAVLFFDSQCADECLFFLFENFYNFSFGLCVFLCGGYHNFYFVAVECVHAVAFGNKYRFVVFVGKHAVFPV